MDCFRGSKNSNVEKPICNCCNKPFDYNKTIDIKNKDSVRKIEFLYEDPEIQLRKVVECMKVSL
jgi:hypothetical protein